MVTEGNAEAGRASISHRPHPLTVNRKAQTYPFYARHALVAWHFGLRRGRADALSSWSILRESCDSATVKWHWGQVAIIFTCHHGQKHLDLRSTRPWPATGQRGDRRQHAAIAGDFRDYIRSLNEASFQKHALDHMGRRITCSAKSHRRHFVNFLPLPQGRDLGQDMADDDECPDDALSPRFRLRLTFARRWRNPCRLGCRI